ncbi:putative RNA polymerase sigma-C factor [Mycobacterium basiliense]|uniref:Putative RNA polymerase sigma-C factor n=1 Tax=Mycobacterium basiliense TaxID=2094119 RepID=A0A447GE92_9MYCO|nr:sigma-70 family RNA polymerase sigma factor [Mycobacterium basiliense]VDM88802.1 putative RNA polymerase sigma-C factor [Mycobacterium basiliense]
MGERCDDDAVTRLALAAARGDGAARQRLIRATERDVWRTVALLGSPGTADDLTQETFRRASGSLPRFTGRASARIWLLCLAHRVVVDQLRHAQIHARSAHDLEWVAGAPQELADIIAVRLLLDGLALDRRHALVLTQVIGLSYTEAAEVCGCPVGTIRSRVAHARIDLLNAQHRDDQVS